MSFRNIIGKTALTNVQSYLSRYTPDQTEDYVQKAFVYYGEVPFLYRVFKPTDVRARKEKGGYKVVSKINVLSVLRRCPESPIIDSPRNFPA
jgi:hypothetical protein